MTSTSPQSTLPVDTLYEQAACGLVTASTDGVILRANKTFCDWLGYSALADQRIQDFFSAGGRVFQQTHCAPLLLVQGSVAEVQVDVVHRDGQRLPMLMNIMRRHAEHGVLDEYAFFVAADRRSYERELLIARKAAEIEVDARKLAELRLQEINAKLSLADRRKDEFLATLAHELRNPLAPMRNVVEVLKHHDGPAPAKAWSVAVLDRQLSHMTHLIDDLMEAARFSQGRMELRRAPTNLIAVLHAALDDVRDTIAAASHRLVLEIPAEVMVVDGDATRLAQIFVNLLNNAAKYTPDGGTITVRAQRSGDTAVIVVRDTGIGIAPQSIGTVFDMFSQLSPALERAQGGLGIGLALVQGLVQLHGGSISAASAGHGQGSEFTLRLPLSDAPLPNVARVRFNAADQRCRVLVIDDNVDAAESMSMALDVFGYETASAHDGAAGLHAVAAFAPNVVLLDIGLPDQSGYEVAQQLRRHPGGAEIYLIAATGWGQEADKALARDAGFDAHLTKPVDFEKLQALLTEAGY